MIKKTIHYVWLSNDEKPQMINKCIATWKSVLSDYEIVEWKAKDFDFCKMPAFVQEAYMEKKWAFVTDYLRLYILYYYGGIYMDSDIFVRKNIDVFLDNGFFSFVEFHKNGFEPNKNLIDVDGKPLTEGHIPGFCIQAAFMGSEKNHPFIRECMDYYENIHFKNPDGSCFVDMIAPDIYALIARRYGFRYIDNVQQLKDGICIYPSSYVGGSLSEISNSNFAIHCCAGSWRNYSPIIKILIDLKSKILQNIYLR